MKAIIKSIPEGPQTLQEAVVFYADEENCIRQMIAARWKNGICCPRCGDMAVTRLRRISRKQTRTIWKCNGCKKQFSVKVGTIFEDSPLPLSKWLVAVWLITAAKNGISSCELHRAIGVTQKTAWFMLHRIREAIATGSAELFNGPVEADETFVGGLEKFKHTDKKLNLGRGSVGKSIVMGILDRGDANKKSRIKAHVVHDTSHNTLSGKINESVKEFATIYTDAWKGYKGLSEKYVHEFIDHTIKYALGQVHTNGIENFWSLLKRCLKGTYIAVQPFHLKRYIDEMVFRFNHRDGLDRDRFLTRLTMIEGKRLTFDELTRSYEACYDQVLPKAI